MRKKCPANSYLTFIDLHRNDSLAKLINYVEIENMKRKTLFMTLFSEAPHIESYFSSVQAQLNHFSYKESLDLVRIRFRNFLRIFHLLAGRECLNLRTCYYGILQSKKSICLKEFD